MLRLCYCIESVMDWSLQGDQTSMEDERERERERERIGNVLFTSQCPVLLHSATLIPVVLTVKLTHPHNTTN